MTGSFYKVFFGSHVVRGFWLVTVTGWCNLCTYWMWCDVDRTGSHIDVFVESVVNLYLEIESGQWRERKQADGIVAERCIGNSIFKQSMPGRIVSRLSFLGITMMSQ